jgi:SSU ribosomal protein S12P methylthiotransferase (EC 2.-.-.-)
VRELLLVSENSTSYGKDLGDLALLEKILPELCDLPGIERVRVSYLQPAEIRPGLLETMAGLEKVMPWYDLSFQHASPTVLRRMRRFGGTEDFLRLVEGIRTREPAAGIRTNVIVGFPGETEEDVLELERFLTAAELDVVGVFAYSDEDGTEAESLPGKIDQDVIEERHTRITDLVEELMAQRAEARIGEDVTVLVDEVDAETGESIGRAEHQGPDVDGVTILPAGTATPGQFVTARVVAAEGVDLRGVRP